MFAQQWEREHVFFDLSCLVSADVFLFVKRRSPFAGVVRTCYPLSMAFDGRLTEKSLIVLLLCYVMLVKLAAVNE